MSKLSDFLNSLFNNNGSTSDTKTNTATANTRREDDSKNTATANTRREDDSMSTATANTGIEDANKTNSDRATSASTAKKAGIYNLIIVDESGSMRQLRRSTLSGINETISTIREAQKEFNDTQKHTLTLVTFDSNSRREAVRTIIDNQPINEVGEFTDYMPNGCTPLYDAMGQSLTTLKKRIRDDKDATAVVTVLTDGLENASTEWNANKLRGLIEGLKAEGWSFSYMGSAHNVKEVTDLLSIDNVVEFSHDVQGSGNTWERERSSRRSYFQKMNCTYLQRDEMSDEELIRRKRMFASEYYSNRVTPGHIEHLAQNEIFVFGSNADGLHGGGAARMALENFGAVWGQGEGIQGQSYAIPTTEGLAKLEEAINRFTAFADSHPEMRFLVTRIGCGNAGYDDHQIAHLLRRCIRLENVALPIEFWRELGLNMMM